MESLQPFLLFIALLFGQVFPSLDVRCGRNGIYGARGGESRREQFKMAIHSSGITPLINVMLCEQISNVARLLYDPCPVTL